MKTIKITVAGAVALAASIIKWEQCAVGQREALGADDCPLCGIYWHGHAQWGDCAGCPIKKSSGAIYCEDTPWMDYCDERHNIRGLSADDAESGCTTDELNHLIPYAQAELKFLQELQARCYVNDQGAKVPAKEFSAFEPSA